METRSRKRAEATGQRPSPARSKRGRLSAPSTSASSTPLPPGARIASRAFSVPTAATSLSQEVSMDSGLESSASASKKDLDKISKRENYKEDDQGTGKATRSMENDKEKEGEKGKEKEVDKDRTRDRNRLVATKGGGSEENEVEGNSSFHQNLASASSALHGLLRKLGAGLDDFLPSPTTSSHQSSKLKRILSGLRAQGEEGRQLDALSQLCELLSIGTEDSLSSFSVDLFVPVLVGLLNHEYNPNMMLLAARALTHLCDALPSSCAAVVHYGVVPCLCARLLTIEYIDLAEQSLQALEKVSQEHPTPCLRAGALIAVLSYLDFFSTEVQRLAVSTAANICRQLPLDMANSVTEAVPILTNLLQHHDFKVVEHACICLTRIAEAFASSPENLDMLCSHGLIPRATRLISVGNSTGGMVSQASLSSSTYTGLIRLLSTCVKGSAAAAESLLFLDISSTLKDILAGSGLVSNISVSPFAANRPPEQLYEIVTLINALLPPMPRSPGPPNGITFSRSIPRKQSPFSGSGKLDDGSGYVLDAVSREKLLHDQPQLLVEFGINLFPILIQVYGSSVNSPVRHKCLMALNKLVYFSTVDMLRSLLMESNISSFLAGVLVSKEPSILITALQIAEMLMQRLPDVFSKAFVKEGVVHMIEMVVASDHGGSSSNLVSPAGRIGYVSANVSGTAPPRPRRGGGRQCFGSKNETGAEDRKGSGINPVGSSPSNSSQEAAIHMVKSGTRSVAIATAKRFKEMYFPGDLSVVDTGVMESLCKLKTLCSKLHGDNMFENKGKCKGKVKIGSMIGQCGQSSGNDEQTLEIVTEILTELGRDDGVSTFEFVGSGVVAALLNYFSCGSHAKDNLMDANVAKLRQHALKRFEQFIMVAATKHSNGSIESPLVLLIRKLQNALGSLERFPVILSHTRSGTGSASIAAGLSALAQPFKLRLCRAPGEKALRDYASNIVLIDPLASLAFIEEFLWPRVQRTNGSQNPSTAVNTSGGGVAPMAVLATSTPLPTEHRPSTRSCSSAAGASTDSVGTNASTFKGKGKVGTDMVTEEHRGPETRNAAARRRAAAANSLKQSHVDLGAPLRSEDEDLDISRVEFDEAVAMEEDILSAEDNEDEEHEEVFGEEPATVCVGEQVHDVRLGDGGDEGAVASTSATMGETPSQLFGLTGMHVGHMIGSVGGLEAGDVRTGASLGSKNSLSFTAAMAGLAFKGLGAGRDHRSLAALTSSKAPPRLSFFLGGRPLNRFLTIFQAVQRQPGAADEDDEKYAGPDSLGGGRRIWDEIHSITYQRADSNLEQLSTGASSSSSSCKATPRGQSTEGSTAARNFVAESLWQQASLLDSVLQGELPCDLDKSNQTYNILLLLRILYGLNRFVPRFLTQVASDAHAEGKVENTREMKVVGSLVPQEEFLNSKLTPKLARQMHDAVALCSGALPVWCHQLTRACPFLFPFETRRQYFQSTAFGLPRALQRLQQQQNADNPATSIDRELRVGRLQRQKVRVSRTHILDSAVKVMELYSNQKAVLEVEYFGEVGTGLGPTLEFYTLLSHDLQKVSLDMWRTISSAGSSWEGQQSVAEIQIDCKNLESSVVMGENGTSVACASKNEDYVRAPYGLFPRPWPPSMDASSDNKYKKVVEYFRLLGRTMAKALQDGRLLDLPLSTAFYKLVLGQELDLYDIRSIDPELGTTLQELHNLVRRKQFLESCGGDKRHAISVLRFCGAKIEDLCLDFTLPGYPDYTLKPGGSNTTVDLDNLEEYVSLVVDASVKTGVSAQMEAFHAGFNQVFQIASLQIFNEEELDYLLCGRRELWVAETLAEHIKFDHGYTASSPPIKNLLDIMGELSPEQQRAFLRFVTGAPRLPPGGLAALSPKFTIVRKHPTGTTGVATAALDSTPPGVASAMGTTLADGDLPSVMTCANYLKLPPYSCKEVMRERLLYAICEGQGSFDLS